MRRTIHAPVGNLDRDTVPKLCYLAIYSWVWCLRKKLRLCSIIAKLTSGKSYPHSLGIRRTVQVGSTFFENCHQSAADSMSRIISFDVPVFSLDSDTVLEIVSPICSWVSCVRTKFRLQSLIHNAHVGSELLQCPSWNLITPQFNNHICDTNGQYPSWDPKRAFSIRAYG